MKVYFGDKGLNSSPPPLQAWACATWELSSGCEDKALAAFTFYMRRLAWAGRQKAPCPSPQEYWVYFPSDGLVENFPVVGNCRCCRTNLPGKRNAVMWDQLSQ